MKASDIMAMNVITVGPETSVREVANILLRNRISALPVVGKHKELIGIISEGDLVRRAELETDPRRPWWLKIFVSKNKEALALEYVKSHAHRVKDIMTREVVTARPATPLRDIATLLEKKSHQTRTNCRKRQGDWNCQSRELHSSFCEFA
jgi:CBS domain-containing protein